MARLAALLATLALLLPAPLALAQTGGGGGAFSPLPPAQPAETPTPEPVDTDPSDDISRETLFLIAAGVIGSFFLLGWLITRDARRNLNESDRAAVEGTRQPGSAPRKQDLAKQKARARAKTRQQKQARRKTRRANRG